MPHDERRRHRIAERPDAELERAALEQEEASLGKEGGK
jgi:hypothetical protein